MTSRISGGRSSRAAASRILLACAVFGVAGSISAQQPQEIEPEAAAANQPQPDVMGPQPPIEGGVPQVDNANQYSEKGDIASDHQDDSAPNPLGKVFPSNVSPSGNCATSCSCSPLEPTCCAPNPAGWIDVEWLRWRLDGSHLPPLVTDGPVSANNPGWLDDPGTRILSGDETVHDEWRDGIRVSGGFWLDCCHTCRLGGDYFILGKDNYDFISDPNSTRIVGRPFYNTLLQQQDLQLVSVPGELEGTAEVRADDEFHGAGATFYRCLSRCCDPCCKGQVSELSWLGGYRFYKYDTNLSINEDLLVLDGTTTQLVPGTTFLIHEAFQTRNEFNGGEIGLEGRKQYCWWWLDGIAKVAMGQQDRNVIIKGQTTISVPDDATITDPGGLLTAVTNIGQYHDTSFVFIPEFRLGGGVCLGRGWSVRAGYNVIFWGDVARAASHLPPGLEVDPRNLPPLDPITHQPPTGAGPEPVFPGIRGTQLVAQGLDFSLIWEF